jgi:cytochrome c oxidase cbb3-type subunit 1
MLALTILMSAFIIAVSALMFFIWSQRRNVSSGGSGAAQMIFAPGEIGTVEEPAASPAHLLALQTERNATRHASDERGSADAAALQQRIIADASSASLVRLMLACAVFWLLLASAFGLISSIKLHQPDWLSDAMWLTFGVTRTLHLNAVAYGWAPMACLGCAIWMLPRLLKTPLRGAGYAMFGCAVWNLGLIAGLIGIANGYNNGLEWLEIPRPLAALLVVGAVFIGMPLLATLQQRKAEHLYVSVWYIGAAMLWMPVLLITAQLPIHHGIEQASANWWFGHNVLGLFYTPLSLAAIYYLLPKVIGRPVENYNLSLIGFWGLAFFYGQVGGHHLIGGPLPNWLIHLSIVQSMMMIIPVTAFSINQHRTMSGHFGLLRHSPTLRFIVLGGMMYTLSSVQGSFEALRSINTITHFTHFTVAHAHLGLYGFVTLVVFGAIYFIMPRISGREWPYPKLIAAHFWLVAGGFALYFVSLTLAGVLQGLAMLDASRPFIDSVRVTQPGLIGRSIGGGLMTLGHLLFAGHFAALLLRFGPQRQQAALLRPLAVAKPV